MDEQQTERWLREQGVFPYGPRWSDEEISRFLKRVERLRKGNGINDMESEKLAEQMLHRDRPGSGDDRRVCLECRKVRDCKIVAVRTVLWRCDSFSMRGAA